jgi:hypothetical protein
LDVAWGVFVHLRQVFVLYTIWYPSKEDSAAVRQKVPWHETSLKTFQVVWGNIYGPFSNDCQLYRDFKINLIMFEERIFAHTVSRCLECVFRKVMSNDLVSEIREKYSGLGTWQMWPPEWCIIKSGDKNRFPFQGENNVEAMIYFALAFQWFLSHYCIIAYTRRRKFPTKIFWCLCQHLAATSVVTGNYCCSSVIWWRGR